MERILFLGDSITDAHHNLQVDEEGLGDGYVHKLWEKFREKGLEAELCNRGCDGFTVQRLSAVFERAKHLKPDFVSILVGVNDVGVYWNTGKTLEEQGFAEAYERLICQIQRETMSKILCMGPFIFPEPEEYCLWIPQILEAEQIIERIAKRYGCGFLPLQEKMNQHEGISTDGIHLNVRGAGILANYWMECRK